MIGPSRLIRLSPVKTIGEPAAMRESIVEAMLTLVVPIAVIALTAFPTVIVSPMIVPAGATARIISVPTPEATVAAVTADPTLLILMLLPSFTTKSPACNGGLTEKGPPSSCVPLNTGTHVEPTEAFVAADPTTNVFSEGDS